MRQALIGLAGALAVAGFVALGTWQVERRAWKHALIARTEANLRAPPIGAPAARLRATGESRTDSPPPLPPRSPAKPDIGRSGRALGPTDAYRRIILHGRYLPVAPVRVRAVTARGGGFWLLAPFADAHGLTIIVNRGFVPADASPPRSRARTVTGLVRLAEPGGAFLRRNAPAEDRWYSRDIVAIAAARRLGPIAPWFVDADRASEPGPTPFGGLTVVAFADNHLAYALTWYALALLAAWGTAQLLRPHDATSTESGRAST